MCWSFLQKPNCPPVSLDFFKRAFSKNPHGCGYMFFDGEQLVVKKAFWDHKKAHESYLEDHKKHPYSNFAVHFRLASGGTLGVDNCHPHVIKKNEWALMHNGVIAIRDTHKSDSAILAEKLSHFSNDELIHIKENKEVMKLASGYNTIVLMNYNDVIIINENNGYWDKGVLYIV